MHWPFFGAAGCHTYRAINDAVHLPELFHHALEPCLNARLVGDIDAQSDRSDGTLGSALFFERLDELSSGSLGVLLLEIENGELGAFAARGISVKGVTRW